MRLLYPLGLLGLIAVPVLIIIYIIKNKYTEQTVTSTYLWTLSERFLKRKNPINRLTGLISLILQILAVVAISFAIAHPVFTLAGQASDYCFILDGSGSMYMQTDGATRFERGKDKIGEIIDGSVNGSTYTLIRTGDTVDVVYREISDKDRALELLNETEASYGASDYTDALRLAQEYFTATPALKTYFVTDINYRSCDNVELVNVADGEGNYTLSTVDYTYVGEGIRVEGKIYSFGAEKELTVSVYFDESETPAAECKIQTKENTEPLDLTVDSTTMQTALSEKATTFSVLCPEIKDFQSLRVTVGESDALVSDNEIIVYNVKHDTSFNTLIVSDTPFFIESALQSLGHRQIEVIKPEEYESRSAGGYGLYIFDSCTPDTLPDGAVWFFNPDRNVDDSGFSFQGEVTFSAAEGLEYNASTSTVVRTLLKGVVQTHEESVSRYVKCSLNRSFTTLMSCQGNPVVFAGSNANGNREVVFAFSKHDSDFVLSPNYLVFINNLLNYTFPAIVDESNYYCGDMVAVNVLPGCTGIRVETPQGKVEYLDTETAVSEYQLRETGRYTVTVTTGASSRTINLYSQTPLSESVALAENDAFLLTGEASDKMRDGMFEDITFVFIILAVLFIADWMVYCYEQYQLR